MMSVGIPPILPYVPKVRLSRWQKYLLGKKCFDNLIKGFCYHGEPPPFKKLSRREQNEWIKLALT